MKRFRMKRKGEKWVSNNRVLLGSSKKDPGRNPNFDTEETKLLISLWGDPVVQRTLITTHRKHTVIAKLAEHMNEYGYNRSAEEINTRIKNLKCFYNRLKKDMETGLITGVTWKHFGAMDEIMTRSIFSVRPNEIPKPSLKYQLEQELEERKKNAELSGDNNSNKNDGNDDLNKIQTLLEDNLNSCSSLSSHSKEDNDDHNSEESMDFIGNTDNLIQIKEEECLESHITAQEIEEAPLIIPKNEPVDDDIEIITDTEINNNPNPETQAPILSEYIQVASSSSSTGPIFSNSRKTVTANSSSLLKTSQSSSTIPQSIVFANQPANGLASQGKISLVPTNFLLQQNNKPQPPNQIQPRPHPQPQQRIICTQPNGQATGSIVTPAGNGRMKVLFVNAFQNGKTPNGATTKEVPFTSLVNTTNTHQTDPGIPINITEHPKPTRVEEPVSIKDQGLELLFNKLIGMQNENNEIQKQRLELERQRLEFEKTIANKLLEALVSLRPSPQTEENTNKRKRSATPEDSPNDIVDNFDNFPLITPKVEKID